MQKVYLNSGIFKPSERENINHVYTIKENWDTICEMDFAKVINSKAEPNKAMTVFFLGESIFINKENSLMNENVFYAHCNATQTRNMVMEHMKFDVSSAFTNLLNEEESVIKETNEMKEEILSAISHLNKQKGRLAEASGLSDNEHVRELIEAIEEEISFLKSEYSKVEGASREATHVSEGLGLNTGDTAEFQKKR